MSMLQIPWIILMFVPIIFALLALREFAILLSFPPLYPERKITVFNALVLCAFCVAGIFGLYALRAHVAHLRTLVEIYPTARFAPERELLSAHDEWVFVTKDSPNEIEQFYRKSASSTGVRFERDTHASIERLLLQKGEQKIFITLERENQQTLIFFSEEGEMRVVSATN